jgi:hypothetical protein
VPCRVRDSVTLAEDRLDPAVRDEHLAARQPLPGIDVEERRAADDDGLGHGGRSYQPATL